MMRFKLLLFTFIFHYNVSEAQTLKRINGSKVSEDSLTTHVQHLMQTANVSGVAISVFNNNEPLYRKTFGFADVQKKIPLTPNTEMYGASLSKMVLPISSCSLFRIK